MARFFCGYGDASWDKNAEIKLTKNILCKVKQVK